MQEAAPISDVVALRVSRIAVLKRLIAFALQLVQRFQAGEFSLARLRRLGRLRRWIAVAIFLVRRIGEGALDAPRKSRPIRTRQPADRESLDFERDEFPLWAPRRPENFERYLDMPFGAAVARICKGVGMTPDWEAWAAEPWAQEEIRARLPASPYADYAPDPDASSPPVAEQPPPAPPRAEPQAVGLAPAPRGAPPHLAQSPPLNRKARRAAKARARDRKAA